MIIEDDDQYDDKLANEDEYSCTFDWSFQPYVYLFEEELQLSFCHFINHSKF